jgi:hypothetical protein
MKVVNRFRKPVDRQIFSRRLELRASRAFRAAPIWGNDTWDKSYDQGQVAIVQR